MPFTLPTEIVQSDKTPRTAIAFDKNSGVKQQSSTAREVLLVGQMLAAGGTATVSVPYELFRENDSEALFGKGSILDFAAKAAFKAHPFVKLSAVAAADAGVKATGTVVFATNATGSTTFQLRIAFVPVQIDITTGDTPTIAGDALVAAITANTSLPVTALNAAGTVTLTAKNGGTVGNGIQLRGAMASSVGMTATVAASLSAGTGAVSIAAALAGTVAKRYHEHAILLDDSVSGVAARGHIDTQAGAEVGFGCHAHQAMNAALGTNTTLALALNASRGALGSINGSESWSVAIAAALAAVHSAEEVPNRPMNTVVLNGIAPPPVEKRWTRTETRNLLDNGCTPLVVVPGEKVAILRSVITGVKNAAGAFDYSTLDIGITRAFDDIRDNIKLMFDTNYPRARWADEDPDGLLPADVATPAKVKQDLIDVCREAQSRGICQQVEALKDQFVVQKVGTHCEFSIPANIVDGMHEKLGSIVLYRRTVTSVS
jgi:phage tail sheath gpL-like